MKLTTDRHEASRGLFAIAELLVLSISRIAQTLSRSKGPFIATQLNSTELNSGLKGPFIATQLNSTELNSGLKGPFIATHLKT